MFIPDDDEEDVARPNISRRHSLLSGHVRVFVKKITDEDNQFLYLYLVSKFLILTNCSHFLTRLESLNFEEIKEFKEMFR